VAFVAAALLASSFVPASSAPQGPRVLKAGQVGDLLNLEPYRSVVQNYVYMEQVLDQLVFNERNEKMTGEAAESWELARDSMSVRLKLRPNMVTHTGTPVNAEMLRWAITNRMIRPDRGGLMYSFLRSYYRSVEVPDPLTLVINFSKPTPHAMDILSLMPIADPRTFVRNDGTEALLNQADKLIGSGPFRLAEYVRNSHVILERFDRYWERDTPKLNRIELRIFGDAASMMAALEAGEIQYAFDPPYRDAARLARNRNFTVHVPKTFGIVHVLMVNPRVPKLRDARVRQAINYAMDRAAMNTAAFEGLGIPTGVCFPRNSIAYTAAHDVGTSANVARAKTLLKQAEVTSLDLAITVPSNRQDMMTIAQVLVANLQAVGITARVDAVEANVWTQRRLSQQFETMLSLVAQTNIHPAMMEASFVFFAEDNPFFRDMPPDQRYLDYQGAFRRGLAASTPADAKAAWSSAAKALVTGAWVDCTVSAPFLHVTSSKVKGLTWTEADKPVFKNVTIDP
jgi:peptide/nickel transport system substrate-binding protein